MTHEECLLWLAEREQECPSCYGAGFAWSHTKRGYEPDAKNPERVDCLACQGQGKAPRFPTLREKCPTRTLPHDWCCQGRGWVSTDNLEATFGALTVPHIWEFHWFAPGRCEAFLILRYGTFGSGPRQRIDNEAAVLALYRAVQEEKP